MAPLFAQTFGNASSIHFEGQQARALLDDAHRKVALMIGARAEEIIFTSGGTEADNLAVFGAVNASGHLITTSVEHPAVLQAAGMLPSVTVVPVNGNGVVDSDDIRRAIRPSTQLISVMHVNNELGVVQPVEEIAKIARQAGVLFHCDGVQAVGKLPVKMAAVGADLYTLSAHKIYGPKGIGALYVRKGTQLRPLVYGGPHERKMRAGTENVPGAVGFAHAADWVMEHSAGEMTRQQALRVRLEEKVRAEVSGAHINGCGARRVANTSNIRFDGIDSEPLLISLDLQGFAVSSGSACSSGATEPSHVLLAIGLTREQARSSIRISLGRRNDEEQVDALAGAIVKSVARLRKLAPAYA